MLVEKTKIVVFGVVWACIGHMQRLLSMVCCFCECWLSFCSSLILAHPVSFHPSQIMSCHLFPLIISFPFFPSQVILCHFIFHVLFFNNILYLPDLFHSISLLIAVTDLSRTCPAVHVHSSAVTNQSIFWKKNEMGTWDGWVLFVSH